MLPENPQNTHKTYPKNFNEILGVSAADVFYLMGSTIKADNSRHQQAVEWFVLMFVTLSLEIKLGGK